MSKAVCGIYKSPAAIRFALGSLRAAGFRRSDIKVQMPDSAGPQDFPYRQARRVPEGALIGAGVGAAVGFMLGMLILSGIFGSTRIENMMEFSQLLILIVSVGAGILLGAASGALAGIGVPMPPEGRYRDYVRDGGFLLSVHADNDKWASRARWVLEHTAAKDINAVEEKALEAEGVMV